MNSASLEFEPRADGETSEASGEADEASASYRA
jgi:hypothetical protein